MRPVVEVNLIAQLESMALGTPVVAANAGSLPEALRRVRESSNNLEIEVEARTVSDVRQAIADLVDPMADDPLKARQPIATQADGLMLTRLSQKLVRPGDAIAKVVGRERLAYRKGALLDD